MVTTRTSVADHVELKNRNMPPAVEAALSNIENAKACPTSLYHMAMITIRD